MECGAGFTYDADTNLTGPEAVRFTMQAAASNGLTLVRSFGHGHDAFKSIILQPRAGMRPLCLLLAQQRWRSGAAWEMDVCTTL